MNSIAVELNLLNIYRSLHHRRFVVHLGLQFSVVNIRIITEPRTIHIMVDAMALTGSKTLNQLPCQFSYKTMATKHSTLESI